MASHFSEEQLDRLEETLRLISYNSNWFYLEPQIEEVKKEMENLFAQNGVLQIDRPVSAQLNESSGIDSPVENQLIPDLSKTGPESEKGREHLPQAINLEPNEAQSLDSLHLRIRDCDRCALCFNRKTIVFGQGNIDADIVFIGEGPGEEEDKTGLAFVGKAGKLLTQIIHSIGLNRKSVYICNVVKCRPPGNRNPVNDEINACLPYLLKQIDLIQPKLIISLGNIATKSLVKDAVGIMKMRGNIIDYNGIPLLPTFHPSYLLRNPSALPLVWSDMRKARQILFRSSPTVS